MDDYQKVYDQFRWETPEYFNPYCSARALLNGVTVAQFGQTNHDLTKRDWQDRVVGVSLRCTSGNCPGRYDDLKLTTCQLCGGKLKKSVQRKKILVPARLPQDVFVAEFDMEQLYHVGLRKVQFTPVPKYPAVERDFSFVFADEISFEQINKAVLGLKIGDLRKFRPVEIFRGGSTVWLTPGSYSILLRATFQSKDRTLREEEVSQWSGEIMAALTRLGGSQRI